MPTSILMIDDDVELTDLVRSYLQQHGFAVATAATAERGLTVLGELAPELLILDVMLPGRSGFELCEQIRAAHDTPIVMLSARGDVSDRIKGLALGADDYLPKPFEPSELLIRIQTVLRRGRQLKQATVLSFGDLKLDLAANTARLGDEVLNLTTAEFALLAFLAQRPGEQLNRDQLSERLTGREWEALSRSVDAVMSRLRQKLRDDPKSPRYIKTVWGVGYMFVGTREAL